MQDDFQRLVGVNLESAFALAQLAHPLLRASGDGVVIFNSSVAGGPTAMSSGSVYALTKVGLGVLLGPGPGHSVRLLPRQPLPPRPTLPSCHCTSAGGT